MAPRIFGDGEQTRDFCFVKDVVRANLLALESDRVRGEVVNIAGGSSVTVNELVAQLATIVGSDATPVHEAPRSGEVRHSRADVSRARMLLGWQPSVSLADGLAATVASFRQAAG